MSTMLRVPLEQAHSAQNPAPDTALRRAFRSGRLVIGGSLVTLIFAACVLTLPLTTRPNGPLYYDGQNASLSRMAPEPGRICMWFGTDKLGRTLLGRCLLGGVLSMAIGLAAAAISVVVGVSVGLIAGYRGGWVDAVLMRSVDVLYGLPYILLVILFKIGFEPLLSSWMSSRAANIVVLFLAIGLVSWLTMARVVRGQVLSLRAQPFVEAAVACGVPASRIFLRHLLPNLIGPIAVYATLIVPQAILQESFLSFLGIGIQAPMPTWGSLASDGLLAALNPVVSRWWMLLFPCILLAGALLSLNFIGDGLRDVFDPRREGAKI